MLHSYRWSLPVRIRERTLTGLMPSILAAAAVVISLLGSTASIARAVRIISIATGLAYKCWLATNKGYYKCLVIGKTVVQKCWTRYVQVSKY